LLVVPMLPERTRAILIYTWEHDAWCFTMSKALGVRDIPVKCEAELNYRLVLGPLVQEYPHPELKHYCTWIILLFPNLTHYCTWIVLLFPNQSVTKERVSCFEFGLVLYGFGFGVSVSRLILGQVLSPPKPSRILDLNGSKLKTKKLGI
jgi:hypothetical protein